MNPDLNPISGWTPWSKFRSSQVRLVLMVKNLDQIGSGWSGSFGCTTLVVELTLEKPADFRSFQSVLISCVSFKHCSLEFNKMMYIVG